MCIILRFKSSVMLANEYFCSWPGPCENPRKESAELQLEHNLWDFNAPELMRTNLQAYLDGVSWLYV
jgi:hypothetical protein